MNATEIVLLILGFISISVSFFVGNRGKDTESQNEAGENVSRDIWTEKEEELVRGQIHTILDEERESMLADTTDQLNRKSNEKIMEFDEFSSQIMEKINHNHEEVVFMYNMLNEKKKELKEDFGKMSAKKKRAEAENPVQTPAPVSASAPVRPPVPVPEPVPPAPKPVRKVKTGEEQVAEKIHLKTPPKKPAPEKPASTEKGSVNDEIIRMYKKGKSVLEISKELDVGQGEVKLMIALYGGNR